MGNQKWTSEEEEPLRAGVAKHGAGKWKHIQSDPEFKPFLYARSIIDLKDKWRNLNVICSQQTRDKSNGPEPNLKDRIAKAADYDAEKVAEDENKMFLAAEALIEAETVTAMVDETKVILQFAMDCVEKAERGQPVIFKYKAGAAHS